MFPLRWRWRPSATWYNLFSFVLLLFGLTCGVMLKTFKKILFAEPDIIHFSLPSILKSNDLI